jgi:eukaryotic-like serine/threonine-protein kinase
LAASDATATGDAIGLAPEKRDVHAAFLATGKAYAAATFDRTRAVLDRYVERWTALYVEACEATHVRGEQSSEVLDLRMECLNQRLSSVRALTDALARADGASVDNALSAASGLPTLDRCADVNMLRAVIRPPDDPAKHAAVTALRERVSRVTMQVRLGGCAGSAAEAAQVVEAAVATGYRPLEAEARYALGSFGDNCLDPATAVRELENAAYAAEASRHDEIAISAAASAAQFYGDRIKNVPLAHHWSRHAEAILERFPGHPILEAWTAQARSQVARLDGRNEEALREMRVALALKQKELGDHLEVAITVMNVGLALHELGRDAESEPLMSKAVAMFRTLSGEDSARLALGLANHAEVLTALGRYPEAHVAIERTLSIWRAADAGAFYIGYGLFKLGDLQLAEGNPRTARASLEQSLSLLQKEDAEITAEVTFALARALWSAPSERPRALTLARQAASVLGTNAIAKDKLARIESWLRERAG